MNDWNQIALVFTDKAVTSKEWYAYVYFIVVNLFIVGVLLQVLTAFFVGGFMIKLSSNKSINTIAEHSRRNSLNSIMKNETDVTDDLSSQKEEFIVSQRDRWENLVGEIAADISYNSNDTSIFVEGGGNDVGGEMESAVLIVEENGRVSNKSSNFDSFYPGGVSDCLRSGDGVEVIQLGEGSVMYLSRRPKLTK